MHQAYFDRKLSQPTTISNPRSITPKPFSRIFEDSNRSPERLHSEFSQASNRSPTVNRQKTRNNSGSLGSSLKLASKVRDQVLYTDRSVNRVNHVYNYSGKSPNMFGLDVMRAKSDRNQAVTKTEPNAELDSSGQTAVLVQKMNKLKADLTQLQDRESLYLTKLSNLEKENKSLHRLLEEKDAKILEFTQKSNDDKLQIYQLVTELEAYKQPNMKQQYNKYDSAGTASSTLRLSDICDSTRKGDKGPSMDKCIQAIESNNTQSNCSRCESVSNYCEHLMNRLNEVDQDSRNIIKEHNSMKELLLRARKAENDSLKVRGEIEKKVIELQNDLSAQTKFLNEVVAENAAVRKLTAEVSDCSGIIPLQDLTDRRKSWNIQAKNSSKKSFYPIPASMKALSGAEKVLKVTS